MSEKFRVAMISKACLVGIYQKKLELIAQQGIELMAGRKIPAGEALQKGQIVVPVGQVRVKVYL